jgi:hypothetical protein
MSPSVHSSGGGPWRGAWRELELMMRSRRDCSGSSSGGSGGGGGGGGGGSGGGKPHLGTPIYHSRWS